MLDRLLTAAIAVIPALLTLIIEQVFSARREKRAARERLLYNFLPKRLEFYHKLRAFIAEDLARCKAADLSTADDIQREAFRLNEQVVALTRDALYVASSPVTQALVRLSAALVALQYASIQAPHDQFDGEFHRAVAAAEHALNVTLRAELYADEMDRLFDGPPRRKRHVMSVFGHKNRRDLH